MAVYTKINNKQIKFIEKKYNIGKIENLVKFLALSILLLANQLNQMI